MKKRSFSFTVFTLFYVFICFLFIVSCSVKGNAAKLSSSDLPAYEVPEGKKQKWEGIQNMVHKEYLVCIEHCGNDTGCLDRCEEVYKNRLDKEYKKLIYE